MLLHMTQHVTIALDDQELEQARVLATSLGVTVEEYMQRIVRGQMHAPRTRGVERELTGSITDIFDLADGPPTDIAVEKDNLIGEAVWREHLRKTRQHE